MASQIPPGVDLCAIPAGVPPDGVTPNLVNPVNLSVETLAVGAVFTALSTLFLVLRLIANWHRMKLADYLTIVGFWMSVGYSATIMAMHGYTRHSWDMPACWYMADEIWKLLFAQNLFLGPTQFLLKVAILTLYFQLFSVYRTMRIMIWAGIIFCGLIYLPHPILVIIFNAPHGSATWADLATNGMPQKLAFYAPIHGIGSIVIDIYIFIIPLLMFRNLQISSRKRMQLIAIFLTGLLGIISSAISCYWRMMITFHSNDYTWQESELFIWIMFEHAVALIVGSMPALAAFIKVQAAKTTIFSTRKSKRYGSGGPSQPNSSDQKPGAAEYPANHNRRARSYYYELNDSLLDTRNDLTTIQAGGEVTVHTQKGEEGGIMRTTKISQDTFPGTAV